MGGGRGVEGQAYTEQKLSAFNISQSINPSRHSEDKDRHPEDKDIKKL